LYSEYLPQAIVCEDSSLLKQGMLLNRQGWLESRDQIRSQYAGQYVALSKGKLIAAAPTFEETEAAVRRIEPMPMCCLIFDVNTEPVFEVGSSQEEAA
jgi:hypothetical protein